MNDTISVDDFARRLPCSRTLAYTLFKLGQVRGFRVGRTVRVYAAEVSRIRKLMANRQRKEEPKAKRERPKSLPPPHLTPPP